MITGIIVEWFIATNIIFVLAFALFAIIGMITFSWLAVRYRYTFSLLPGLLSLVLFYCLGAALCWQQDIRNDPRWLGHLKGSTLLVVTIIEEPVEKPKSFRALARADFYLSENGLVESSGRLILYFKKDSSVKLPGPGARLLLKKLVQPIKSTGNPGAFDYRAYAFLQGITHQLFLGSNDYIEIPGGREHALSAFLSRIRGWILSVLRKYIKGETSLGLAEALLIGYKDDLDRSLVQSYTNTGVVHIIAISGLHLGLIYFLLTWLTRPLKRIRRMGWLSALLSLACLWLFSFLAGAQPSVLRSAVMFSFLVLGEGLSRRNSAYNTLAMSAFFLLCIDPYWIWDIGFQLSYSAVLSIMLFMKPVYHSVYCKNKFLDICWKMTAVTLAAQVLTVPLCIYHFHQFPTYFLLTNFIAVPLSSAILIAEIILACIFWLPALALPAGQLITWMIRLMNAIIQKTAELPFAVWEGLQLSVIQAVILTLSMVLLFQALRNRSTYLLKLGLTSLLFCFLLRAVSFFRASAQRVIIVYNIPGHSGIDLLQGRKYIFLGDSILTKDPKIQDAYLRTSRSLYRVTANLTHSFIQRQGAWLIFGGRLVFCCSGQSTFPSLNKKIPIDLLIISGKGRLQLTPFCQSFTIRQVVIDGSVLERKGLALARECDSLHIPFHHVNMEGAFVMHLP